MARTNGFILDLALIALSVQVGYIAMPMYQTFQPWINVQSNYLRQIEAGLNRIVQFDQAAQVPTNVIWNAQRNMNSFVKYTLTSQMNETVISKVPQDYLTNLAPSYRWMVYTYTSV